MVLSFSCKVRCSLSLRDFFWRCSFSLSFETRGHSLDGATMYQRSPAFFALDADIATELVRARVLFDVIDAKHDVVDT